MWGSSTSTFVRRTSKRFTGTDTKRRKHSCPPGIGNPMFGGFGRCRPGSSHTKLDRDKDGFACDK
ncbi:hypothetical protein GXW84_42445 [Rhodococcus sp. IEGM 248]|nr:hypothetical protein [Rhodococcus sp. IEGM 248]